MRYLKKFSQILLLDRLLYKVDPGFSKHGGDLVAQVLKQHKIKQVFTLCGGHVSPILVGCEKQGIRVVDTRHEASAAFAADASARCDGEPGVCIVTAGPGLTNTVTALKNAQMAESPVLVICGAAATLLKGRGSLQDIDQLSVFSSICKHRVTVARVREIVPAVSKALHSAQTGTPGPVLLELPLDILYPYSIVRSQSGLSANPKSLLQKVVNWYISTAVDAIFAGATYTTLPRPPIDVTLPPKKDVSTLRSLLAASKQPLILLGSQATLPPVRPNTLVKALVDIGAPCYLGGMSRGMLGAHHPLFMRQQRKVALREADLIILAGAVCDFRLDYGRSLNKKAKVVIINRDQAQLSLNHHIFWSAALQIKADVGSTLKEVSQGAVCGVEDEWRISLRLRDDEKEKENASKGEPVAGVEGVNPVRLFQLMDTLLTDKSVLVADGGDFVATAAYVLRPRGPLCWFDPGAFGTLGVGGGFAMGVKAARPDSEVWLVWGDGSSGYSLAEIDSMTRQGLPCIAIIGNDGSWGQIAREQGNMLGSNVGCHLVNTDYHKVAEGYGGKGLLIPASASDEEILATLREAQALCAAGHAVVVNVMLARSDFRAGSISV